MSRPPAAVMRRGFYFFVRRIGLQRGETVKEALLQALEVCPPEVRAAAMRCGQAERIEELRFRAGQEAAVSIGDAELPLHGCAVDRKLLADILARATGQAVYAAQDMLKNGFVTISGGHRLGVCGTGVCRDGEVYTFKDISSLNLRVAREIRGAASEAADYLWLHPVSTLILGAPASGKTTLLRDLIRQCSDRFGWRICAADERMELAACRGGVPQFDLGAHTDVLSGVAKGAAIELLLRSMNPHWIAVDEITAESDVDKLVRAGYCGVRFLATVHAASFAELERRPVYRTLLRSGMFESFLLLGRGRRLQIRKGVTEVA